MKHTIYSLAIILSINLLFVHTVTGQTVTPERTTTLAAPADFNTNIRLKAGRLTSTANTKNATTLKKFVDADLCIDVSLSDGEICDVYGKDDASLVTLFKNMQTAIKESGVEVWGVHLPYSTVGKGAIATGTATQRNNAVAYQNKLIDLCVQYIKPKVIVTHPGTPSVYPNVWTDLTSSTDVNYYNARDWSRDALVKMQAQLDQSLATYGGNTILCVENCMRQVTHDALALLDFLDYPGLEKVKVCLDTGHALIPHNSHYLDLDKVKDDSSTKTAVQEGDVITMLHLLGDKLGTLHIQQNHGLIGRIPTETGHSSDTHLLPYNGGLIDWGEFYYVLLKNIGYRGCFLYEVSYKTKYKDTSDKVTIADVQDNYATTILPAYNTYLTNLTTAE